MASPRFRWLEKYCISGSVMIVSIHNAVELDDQADTQDERRAVVETVRAQAATGGGTFWRPSLALVASCAHVLRVSYCML